VKVPIVRPNVLHELELSNEARADNEGGGNVAETENFAPPRIACLLTQMMEFISMMTDCFPVARIYPFEPRNWSRE